MQYPIAIDIILAYIDADN